MEFRLAKRSGGSVGTWFASTVLHQSHVLVQTLGPTTEPTPFPLCGSISRPLSTCPTRQFPASVTPCCRPHKSCVVAAKWGLNYLFIRSPQACLGSRCPPRDMNACSLPVRCFASRKSQVGAGQLTIKQSDVRHRYGAKPSHTNYTCVTFQNLR